MVKASLSVAVLWLSFGCSSHPPVAESFAPNALQSVAPTVSSCYNPERSYEENLKACVPNTSLPQPGLFQTDLNRKDDKAPCDVQLIDLSATHAVLAFLAGEHQDPGRCNVRESIEAKCTQQDHETRCSWQNKNESYELTVVGAHFFTLQEKSAAKPMLYARRILGREVRGILNSGSYRPSWQSGDCVYTIYPVLAEDQKLSHVFVVGQRSYFAACTKRKDQQRLFVCDPAVPTGLCWRQQADDVATMTSMTPRGFHIAESHGIREFYFRME